MPVWPQHPRVKIKQVSSIAQGDTSNLTRLNLGCHTGTHVDAPHHFVDGGLTVDQLPLDLLMGPAFVAELDRLEENCIEVYDLASLHFPRDTERLLLKTSNSYFWEDRISEFVPSYVHLSYKAAEWLVKRGIRLVGVDYMSVDAFGSIDHRVHQTLLGAGVVIVEGLNLSRVPAGHCRLVCLPLKIEGGDGAPARVLVIRD
jgi:arylformamidase